MHFLLIFFVLFTVGCASSTYYYKNGKKSNLIPIEKRSLNTNTDFYKTKDGLEVGVNNSLLVKFKNTNNLSFYLKEYDLSVLKQLSKNLYLLKTSNKSKTIEISNLLYQKNDIEYAHPNFVKKKIYR